MRHIVSRFIALMTLALGFTATAAYATPSQPATLAEMAVQRHFSLTDEFLGRYEAAQADISKNACSVLTAPGVHAIQQGKTLSLDDAAARYASQPGMQEILSRHGITPKQMVLANSVLSAARLKYMNERMRKAHSEQATVMPGSVTAISQENYTFFVAHRDQIQRARRAQTQSQSPAELKKRLACLSNKLKGQ